MKKFNIHYFFILIISILVYSCAKEPQIVANAEKPFHQTQYEILAFDNQDDFAAQIVSINEMGFEELVSFQNANNYQSYGVFCDELYSVVADDSLNVSALISSVNSNSNYLEFIIEENGDTTLAAKYGNTPFYYIMNINRMYIVGELVFKVFPEGQLSCNISNYSNLLNANDENLNTYLTNSEYSFIYFFDKENAGAKDNAYNLGVFKDIRATNGKDRTLTQVEIYTMANSPAYQYASWQLVRPYKKTAGIWYFCKRTIAADFKTAIDLPNIDGTNFRYRFPHNKTKYDYKVDFLDVFFRKDNNNTTYPHYAGYKARGDTPSTDPATFSANVSIL